MTKNRAKLGRLERRAVCSARAIDTARPALLACVLAKAERLLRGDALELASHQATTPDMVAHRERLLEWVERQQD